MDKMELFEKHKSKILNFAILFLAIFIALQFYKLENQKINSLIRQQKDELKKNMVIEEIAVLEKKFEGYKKVFTKKDMSSVMGTISNIAQRTAVNIVSIKPIGEEVNKDYIKSTFLITLATSNFHSLGNFISQVEKNKDIYIVDEVSIKSAPSYGLEDAQVNLNINLKISTISYL